MRKCSNQGNVASYADSLGENRDKLDTTIELLEQTSILVENFRDHRPIHEMLDLSKIKRF